MSAVMNVIGADAMPSPKFAYEPKTIVMLGKPGDRTEREITYERRIPRHGSLESRLVFTDRYGATVELTDEKIGFLLRKGEFRIVVNARGDVVAPMRSPLDLSEGELARCKRKQDYVDACLALGRPFDRMRIHVEAVLRTKAAARGEVDVPPYTTVLGWMDRHQDRFAIDGIACFARNVPRLSDVPPTTLEEAVRVGVTLALGNPAATGAKALEKAQEWLVLSRREDLFDDLPDLRTFQRRLAGVHRFTRLSGEYGPRFADRVLKASYEQARPELPLEEVEVDHTPLDLLVLSDDGTIVLGRPDVISFRDRHSGCCLGLSIGWEAPSYASFLDGLRHAIYPKDMSAFPGIQNPWFCWGRFRRLFVDNALHFIGLNIQNAATELNFQLAEMRPGNPWLKGAQEKMLGDLNMQVHVLQGSTFSNVLQRRDRAEIAQIPVLTLRELRAYLFKWICDDYLVKEHEGLGFLRTLKGVPRRLWTRSIEEISIAPLPDETAFVSLAGDVHFRAVNAKGIRLENIRYNSRDLEAIRCDRRHRDGRDDDFVRGMKHTGSRYRVHRDPFDLSRIWVRDPYRPGTPAVEVPACRQDYARGLTLHQHLVNLNNADKDPLHDDETDPEDELVRARARVAGSVTLLQEVRKVQKIERRLGRYLWAGQQRELRSIVVPKPVDADESRGSLLQSARKGAENPRSPPVHRLNPEDFDIEAGPLANGASDATPLETTAFASGPPPRDPGIRKRPAEPGRAADGGFDPEAFERELSDDDSWSKA